MTGPSSIVHPYACVAAAMICQRGGLIIQRHNEICNLEAELLDMVCYDVTIANLSSSSHFQDSTLVWPKCHLNVLRVSLVDLSSSVNFRSSTNNRWLMGFMSFASLYPADIFPSTWVKGNMITINISGDKESS